MRRGNYHDEPAQDDSEDSFLDVVANVVGVLIILVMLVGAQASRSVLPTKSKPSPDDQAPELAHEQPQPDLEDLREQLRRASEEAIASRRAIQEIATSVVKLTHETQAYDQKRVELAMHRSLIEEDLQRREDLLDEGQQRQFEVQRQLLETKLDLEKLTQEQLALISAPTSVQEIECVPTPIAREVEGKSIHLRLHKGLVSVVPFDELMEEVEYNIEGTRRRLHERGHVVETYGPLDGYRLKMTIAQIRDERAVGGPLVGQPLRTKIDWEAEVIPVSTEIGQNVEQSLLPGGVLRKHLLAQQRLKPAVVVWLYTDSFDEFRPLKRALWEMGFSLATRPMRPGSNIKASPHGTRAAAQ